MPRPPVGFCDDAMPRLGLKKAVSRFRRHYYSCHHHHCYLGWMDGYLGQTRCGVSEGEGVCVLGGMASPEISDVPDLPHKQQVP
jgi:hypothetical protein